MSGTPVEPAEPAPEPAPDPAPDPAPGAPLRRARLRRAPRYGAFVATGAAVGVLAAVVLALVGAATDYGRGAVLGWLVVALGLLGALAGGLVGAVAGILADRSR